MKKIIIFAILITLGLYLHAKMVFSASRIEKTMDQSTLKMLRQDSDTCDIYADDLSFKIKSSLTGTEETDTGGKKQLCDYGKMFSVMMSASQASLRSQTSDYDVVIGAFPWNTATVTYKEETFISMPRIESETLSFASQEHLTLKRGLTGFQITELSSIEQNEADQNYAP